MSDTYGIYIGHKVEAIKEIRDLIVDVVHATNCGDNVKIAALEAIPELLKIQHVSINNNNISTRPNDEGI